MTLVHGILAGMTGMMAGAIALNLISKTFIRRGLRKLMEEADDEIREETRVEVLSRQLQEARKWKRKADVYDQLMRSKRYIELCDECHGGVEVRTLSDPLPPAVSWCDKCDGRGSIMYELKRMSR